MAFSIFDICRCVLLILNGMAILNERRFLSKYGIVPPNAAANNGGGGTPGTPSSPAMGDFAFSPTDFGEASKSGIAADSSSGGAGSFKQQVGQLLFSVRLLLRWPIVIANLVMVVLTIVFG